MSSEFYAQEMRSTRGNGSYLPNGCQKTARNVDMGYIQLTKAPSSQPTLPSPSFFSIHSLGANKLRHDPFLFYSFFVAPVQLLLKATGKFGCTEKGIVQALGVETSGAVDKASVHLVNSAN